MKTLNGVLKSKTAARTVSIVILFLWAGALGYALSLVWGWGMAHASSLFRRASADEFLGFALAAFIFGALGGLARAILELRNYAGRDDEEPSYQAEKRLYSHLFVIPLLWPVLGALFGFILTTLLLDAGVNPLRIALVAFLGGLFVGGLTRILRKIFLALERAPKGD